MKTIQVTFTEEDRQKAGHYGSNTDCLLATALKRMGHETYVGGYGMFSIGTYDYYPTTDFLGNLIILKRSVSKPFYKKSIVGKTWEFKAE